MSTAQEIDQKNVQNIPGPRCPHCGNVKGYVSGKYLNWLCKNCGSFSCGDRNIPHISRLRMCKDLGVSLWQLHKLRLVYEEPLK